MEGSYLAYLPYVDKIIEASLCVTQHNSLLFRLSLLFTHAFQDDLEELLLGDFCSTTHKTSGDLELPDNFQLLD